MTNHLHLTLSTARSRRNRATILAGSLIAAAMTAQQTDSGPPTGFKTCHGMSTDATLDTDTAVVTATTRIWSHCWFGGFTGRSVVLLVNSEGQMVGFTNGAISTFGVNGLFEASLGFGPSDRTEFWADVPTPTGVPRTASIRIVHTHAPQNRLIDVLNAGVAIASPVTHIVTMIKSLA